MNKLKKNWLVRAFFNIFYRFHKPEMVKYWKDDDIARAKLTTINGSYAMLIEGEKYPLWGFPRGPVLFGALARLKLLFKDLIFNKVWELLENGKSNEEVMEYVKKIAIPALVLEIEKNKYDFFPPERLCPAMKELWRAMSKVSDDELFTTLKKGITFFFQEDDAYRFRVQWIMGFLNPNNFLRRIYRFITRKPYSFKKELEIVLNFLKDSEITPDMKPRATLIKRVLLAFMEDKQFGELIEKTLKEINYKKMKLGKGDRYYFRGKYFKVDNSHFDY